MKKWFYSLFDQSQWAREKIGGRWECWWVEPIMEMHWMQVEQFYEGESGSVKRPGACWPCPADVYLSTEAFPIKEDYTKKTQHNQTTS